MGEIAYHETGHCLHAPLADDRFVPGEFGKRLSVPRELAAWRWTLDRIPVWTEAMHAFMARCLKSYRAVRDRV